MKTKHIIFLFLIAFLISSCTGKRNNKATGSVETTEHAEDKHMVYSDDSLVVAYWWDTGEGGTAPDIEALYRFRTEDGGIGEETRPLLRIVHPGEDYGHREVKKIVSLDTEHGRRLYLFHLRAKVGSNEYAHDIVAFCIEGDCLIPAEVFTIGKKAVAHASINENVY